MIYCGMCNDTGLQNGQKCPQRGCRKANQLAPFDFVNLYYAEICDSIPGVLSSGDAERLTREYLVLRNVRRSIADAYVQSFDHFRARWRVEVHCSTVQERTEKILKQKGMGTGYDPRELDELRRLWQTLPQQHRAALRCEIIATEEVQL